MPWPALGSTFSSGVYFPAYRPKTNRDLPAPHDGRGGIHIAFVECPVVNEKGKPDGVVRRQRVVDKKRILNGPRDGFVSQFRRKPGNTRIESNGVVACRIGIPGEQRHFHKLAVLPFVILYDQVVIILASGVKRRLQIIGRQSDVPVTILKSKFQYPAPGHMGRRIRFEKKTAEMNFGNNGILLFFAAGTQNNQRRNEQNKPYFCNRFHDRVKLQFFIQRQTDMQEVQTIEKKIFSVNNEKDFERLALEVFRFQYAHNTVYRRFADALDRKPHAVQTIGDIPFLPIELFKTHRVVCGDFKPEAVFLSSGTTGATTSRHYVKSLGLYEKSFLQGFQRFFGKPEKYVVLALLPSYLERTGSSLVYMADRLIRLSGKEESGFYLNDYKALAGRLLRLKQQKKPVILLGVTYALLDLAEQFPIDFPELMVMETGGMKGRRREMVRDELHGILRRAFGVEKIFSEYGMTELLSQAYSRGNGLFTTPPWMKVLMRDVNDPLSYVPEGKSGGINVIDLANLYSCSFIATQDLGKRHSPGGFEVLGRFDNSDVRGCNLLVG